MFGSHHVNRDKILKDIKRLCWSNEVETGNAVYDIASFYPVATRKPKRTQDGSYLHEQQDNTGLNKERKKSQPTRRRNQEESSNPEQNNWKIGFKWVKVHARIFGNEIADRIAKEATQNYYVTYRRIPKSAIKRIPGKKV
jgi:hypothetical protein